VARYSRSAPYLRSRWAVKRKCNGIKADDGVLAGDNSDD
jgi:hypothetical protein